MQENKTIKRSYNIKNLFLDPNNYRFVDNENYKNVSEDKLTDPNIQKRTRRFIEGEKRENIKDLILSFKANGFLDVDVIQVRDLGDNKYLVIEGNRRVTALKALQEDYEHNSADIGKLNPEIFKKVPFEIHDNESKEKHLIIMGLKHISGNKKWSALNQAKLIYDYLNPYWGTEEYYAKENELCNSLGISKQLLRTSQRAYHLIIQYKNSDFGDQFQSSDYSIFIEIVKKPAIKEWLNWDDQNYIAQNSANLERLFSWISKNYELIDEENDEYQEIEPIITKALEVRDLAIFINDEKAIKIMEETKSISQALVASGKIEQINYERTLNDLESKINQLDQFKSFINTNDDFEKIKKIKKSFLEILPKETNIGFEQGNISICFKYDLAQHFDTLEIVSYKAFKNFKIDKLNKINIFVGLNNSGKTSLLEAVYMLTKQNDISSILKLIQLKNKLDKLSSKWLNKIFTKNIEIKGRFNNLRTSVKMEKFEANNIDKKNDYITSYRLVSYLENRDELENVIHTFEFNPIKRENKEVEILCNSIFKSPYFYSLDEVINTYSKNLKTKHKSQSAINIVIDFIKKIDPTINDIRLSEEDDVRRFIVDSSRFIEENLEITNYGEGLQRIFEIALSFAYAKNGVVCIDEFETAIHYTLLVDFTKFIQELAEIFNVQVFLTTHSKEAIDAFVNNNYKNDEISAYLIENNEQMKYKFIGGERLDYLVKNIDLDIRGEK
jgi:AAA15 family ATPase/GTPase